MPKKRWSAHDEQKYKGILRSCKLSQGRKKGVTKECKRIAAATVERDRGLEALGIRRPAPMRGLRSLPARGMGAQLVSIDLGGTVKQHRARARELIAKGREVLPYGPQVARDLAVQAGDELTWVPRRRGAPPGLSPEDVAAVDLQKDAGDKLFWADLARREEALREGSEWERTRATREQSDEGLAGLGCACSDGPSGLGGKKRKRSR